MASDGLAVCQSPLTDDIKEEDEVKEEEAGRRCDGEGGLEGPAESAHPRPRVTTSLAAGDNSTPPETAARAPGTPRCGPTHGRHGFRLGRGCFKGRRRLGRVRAPGQAFRVVGRGEGDASTGLLGQVHRAHAPHWRRADHHHGRRPVRGGPATRIPNILNVCGQNYAADDGTHDAM